MATSDYITYPDLFKTVQGYVENDFPSGTFASSTGAGTTLFTSKDQIDTFIRQAEQRIYNTVQFPIFRKNQTGTLLQDQDYLSSPSDFLAVYSLAVIDASGNYYYLLNKDVNFLREAYPNPTETGLPKYYAIFGPTVNPSLPQPVTNELSFLIAPRPNLTYTVQIHYYYYPQSIVDSTSERTWLGDNFSSALLYGALVEAYTYMKGEPDVIAGYTKRYEEAMILAKRLGDGMERRDAYRSGQARMQVN